MYAQDYDETYVPKYNCERYDTAFPDHCLSPALPLAGSEVVPDVPLWLPGADDEPGTPYLLQPYVKSDGVWLCPSRRTRPPLPGDTKEAQGRYTINGWDSSWADKAKPGLKETSPQGQPDSAVPEPATTLFAWEHANNSGECQNGQEALGSDGPDTLGPSPNHWTEEHSGGLHALWCDGHVKWTRASQLRRRMFSIQQD